MAGDKSHRMEELTCMVAGHRWLWVTNLLVVGLILAGCSGINRPLPPLSDLHLPGVSQVPGIPTLHASPQLGYIQNLATYVPVGQATPHVLFTLDSELYTVGLDGTDLASLQVTCDGQIATSPDGHWALCEHDHQLAVISLTTPPPHNSWLLALPASPFGADSLWGDPTWLPIAQYLAVVTHLEVGARLLSILSPPVSTRSR